MGQRSGDGSEPGVSEGQKEVPVCNTSQFLSLIFRRKCGITHLNSHPTAGEVIEATLKVWSRYLE